MYIIVASELRALGLSYLINVSAVGWTVLLQYVAIANKCNVYLYSPFVAQSRYEFMRPFEFIRLLACRLIFMASSLIIETKNDVTVNS